MARDAFRPTDALNAFWDNVALGRAPIVPHVIDGETVDLVKRLHALGDPPERDSTRERVWRDLRQHRRWKEPDMTTPSLSLHGVAGAPLAAGTLSGIPPGPTMPPTRQPFTGRWAAAHVATLLLVLSVVLGSLLVFGSGQIVPSGDTPAILPALSGTPATPETITTQPLFDLAVEALPSGWSSTAVVRWSLPAGSRPLRLPPQDGPRFVRVESGEVTATEAGAAHRLGPGDAYVAADPGQEVAIRVSGTHDASLLQGFVTSAYLQETWAPGVHTFVVLLEGISEQLPGESGFLVLEQLTAPRGETLPPLEATSLVWLDIGEGTLGLTLEGDAMPLDWTAGEEQTLLPIDGFPQQIPTGTRMTLRNAGNEPLVLSRMTLTPDAANASAAGTPRP